MAIQSQPILSKLTAFVLANTAFKNIPANIGTKPSQLVACASVVFYLYSIKKLQHTICQ